MGRVRRNWTPKEDELLRRAVENAEAQQRPLLWRELAKAVPGRSNKDCRRRWWNSLADGNAKGPWSEEEDERLIAAVQKHGTNWTQVANEVGSRGSDQCSSHWSHVLDPNINYCDWTEEEDADLLHEVLTHGTKWAHISSCHNPARTTLALKNRYSTLRLKNENRNRARQEPSTAAQRTGDYHNEASSINVQRLEQRKSKRQNGSNRSESSELPQADDDDDDDDDDEAEEESDQVIHVCMNGSENGDENNHNNNQHHGAEVDTDSAGAGGMSVQIPDATLASWDAWAKFSGMPTPHTAHSTTYHAMSPTEAVGMDLDNYLQLGSPVMLNQSAQQASPLSDSCFYTNEEPRATGQSNPFALHDNTGCGPATSTSPTNLAVTPTAIANTVDVPMEPEADASSGQLASTANASSAATAAGGGIPVASQPGGWGVGTVPKGNPLAQSPPWHQESPASSLTSMVSTSSSKFRVSITMACDQDQLMAVITQLSQYGNSPSINVQKE